MKNKILKELPLHIMLLPAVLILLVFHFVPLFGIVIAFQDFKVGLGISGSEWCGWENFQYVMALPSFWKVIRNTFFIAIAKLVLNIVVPLIFALMLNEISALKWKKFVQTVSYLPHFLSWVILGGILVNILSPSSGIVNQMLGLFGVEPIFFLGTTQTYPWTIIISDVLKGMGYSAVIYIASLTSIDPSLYEAAVVDGAGRWKQTLHITIPGLLPTVILMGILAMSNVLNAGFDQVYNTYSVVVYETGDIIDTFVYRLGLVDFQFGPATAVGLFKSAISTIMIVLSYKIAYVTTGYKVL